MQAFWVEKRRRYTVVTDRTRRNAAGGTTTAGVSLGLKSASGSISRSRKRCTTCYKVQKHHYGMPEMTAKPRRTRNRKQHRSHRLLPGQPQIPPRLLRPRHRRTLRARSTKRPKVVGGVENVGSCMRRPRQNTPVSRKSARSKRRHGLRLLARFDRTRARGGGPPPRPRRNAPGVHAGAGEEVAPAVSRSP